MVFFFTCFAGASSNIDCEDQIAKLEVILDSKVI